MTTLQKQLLKSVQKLGIKAARDGCTAKRLRKQAEQTRKDVETFLRQLDAFEAESGKTRLLVRSASIGAISDRTNND